MAKGKRSIEVQAGLVVLAALVVLGLFFYWVSGGKEQFEDKARYTVLFRHGGGIDDGDVVRLDGRRVGKVDGVGRKIVKADEGTIRYVAVTILISAAEELPDDSKITVSKTVTGTTTLDIASGTSAVVADEKTELLGEKLDSFEDAINNASKLMAEVREVVQHVDKVVGHADEVVLLIKAEVEKVDLGRIQGKVEGILDEAHGGVRDARQIVADARVPVQEALANVRSAAAEADGLMKDVRRDWRSMKPVVDGILANARDATASVKGIVEENREPVKTLLQNVKDASYRVGPVLEKLESLSTELRGTVFEARPKLLRTISHAEKAMANIKATTEDLKTAPWKLVRKGSEAEASALNLYNAARLYVESAEEIGKLVDEIDTLRRLEALDDPKKKEQLEELMRRLSESLEDYDGREKKLVELLGAKTK